ncbi:MAG: hypothetical protein EZS28_031005 [Streblomastix strix]|uniref:Uncharacterized protein n=1 Tax=Streblomastix strix TaxID=222440 RepID=A0A5J4USR3_9EUKA|nr:MAG: hypothetical protein EZS28_031005 [Streblomastix strix]
MGMGYKLRSEINVSSLNSMSSYRPYQEFEAIGKVYQYRAMPFVTQHSPYFFAQALEMDENLENVRTNLSSQMNLQFDLEKNPIQDQVSSLNNRQVKLFQIPNERCFPLLKVNGFSKNISIEKERFERESNMVRIFSNIQRKIPYSCRELYGSEHREEDIKKEGYITVRKNCRNLL